MKKPEAPCLLCQKSGSLHSRCQKYKDYKMQLMEWNKQVKDELYKDYAYQDMKYNSITRYKKWLGIKGKLRR